MGIRDSEKGEGFWVPKWGFGVSGFEVDGFGCRVWLMNARLGVRIRVSGLGGGGRIFGSRSLRVS